MATSNANIVSLLNPINLLQYAKYVMIACNVAMYCLSFLNMLMVCIVSFGPQPLGHKPVPRGLLNVFFESEPNEHEPYDCMLVNIESI
jgi:hypothetical protein